MWATGNGQLDVAHALAANAGDRHLDAAAIADDVLVLDPLVLAAGALVVAHRAEDLLAEEAARLGLEGAVVDRFGILHLALGPFADGLGGGDGDGHAVERALVQPKGGASILASGGGGVGRLNHSFVKVRTRCPPPSPRLRRAGNALIGFN